MIVKSRLGRRRGGLRQEWRSAFILLLAALGLATTGTAVAFAQVVGHYRAAASQLEHTLALSAELTDAITDHESLAHTLWNGEPVDRAAYVDQERQITILFSDGLRDLPGRHQQDLLRQASQIWREVLVSRGLFGPSANPLGGVTLAMQQQFGHDSDEVAGILATLSRTAIADGSHDIAMADSLEAVVLALLAGMFALVLGVTLYFARRMRADVIRPLEVLQRAAVRLREGELEHRVELPSRSRANEIGDLAATLNDMAGALHKINIDLGRQASHDALTGLSNRATFHRQLDNLVGKDMRSQADAVSVLFIDVDDFKFVNDSLGHAAGDTLLAALADRLATCVRPTDVVARLGGDEFAILITGNATDSTSAVVVAERIAAALRAPFTLAGETVTVGVSIGISDAYRDIEDPLLLLAEADFAMYTAKRHGKGRYAAFDSTMREAAAAYTMTRTTAALGTRVE